MSTESVVHFQDNTTRVSLWLATDGMPEGVGADIKGFLRYAYDTLEGKVVGGAFLDNPEVLACKYIVYKANQYQRMRRQSGENPNILDFHGITLINNSYESTCYNYYVNCDHLEDGLPIVTCCNGDNVPQEIPAESTLPKLEV